MGWGGEGGGSQAWLAPNPSKLCVYVFMPYFVPYLLTLFTLEDVKICTKVLVKMFVKVFVKGHTRICVKRERSNKKRKKQIGELGFLQKVLS